MELAARGQKLWNALLTRDPSLADDDNPNHAVALTACRTADRVDVLEEWCVDLDPDVVGRAAASMHPAWAEVRQQATLLARLIAALRLPDVVSGKKPMPRGAVRGMNQPERLTPLERARERAAS